jgi:hypothetical protein
VNGFGPVWLATIFGVILLCAAAYSIGRIVYARRTRKRTDYEVDASDSLMGISMAGMLIPGLGIVTPGPSTVFWIALWILAAVWFAISIIRRAVPNSRSPVRRHHLPHFVFAVAMVYMLAAGANPSGSGGGAGSAGAVTQTAAGMGGAGGGVPFVTLDLLFLLFMVGYTVLAVDRLPALTVAANRPRIETAAPTGSVAAPTGGAPTGAATAVLAPTALATTLFAPRLAAATNIVMAVSMGYMLTMMLG